MRLEKIKHIEAEIRVRDSILRACAGLPSDYEGRDEDLALLRRKRHEGRDREMVGRRRSA